MFVMPETSRRTLRAVLRTPPLLEPEESLGRFAQLMRFEPMGMLPVVRQGVLCGILAQTDLLPLLNESDERAREIEMESPVSEWMRPPGVTLRANMSLGEVEKVFAGTEQSMLPVLDEHDYYLGVVAANDLLVPELPAPRPARIGGMATPFGVYLTDGTVQAGVGNLALVSSGLMMGLLMALSAGILRCVLYLISQATHRPVDLVLLFSDDVPPHNPWIGLASIGVAISAFVIFILLMRATPLAGYHAAEHQTVHAIERCEVLTPGIVRRMPRVHPRCGTNLMAAVLVFFALRQALGYVPALNGLVEVMAGVVTLFVWRPVGSFLQDRFTTKPAGERELASGIAAGDALLAQYLEAPPARPTLARRIWCSGMIQVTIGSLPFMLSYNYADSILRFFHVHL